ncbi:MAG TPA: hypothetical protein VJ945_04815 [Flavobacteriaceae bacterium]|nr:hypothetical protein [Flavobacteriaceae bacterium]
MFGKQLDIYDVNIVHLDSTMASRRDLKINPPKAWEGFSSDRGKFRLNGNSVDYIFASKYNLSANYRKDTQAYLDSLLRAQAKN